MTNIALLCRFSIAKLSLQWYTLPIMKKTRGFSYIEVIIALALFAIAMLAVVPALAQAGRNMQFAEGAYSGHLQAQRIMLVVRDELTDDNATPATTKAAAITHADGDFDFSIWVFGRNAQSFHTIEEPDIDVAISGLTPTISSQTSTIIAVVWGDEGQILGRAIGMLYPN